jgi:hypothetical protein
MHNEELHNLYVSPDIIRAIKLRRMSCMVNVTYMGEMKNTYNTFVGKREGKTPLRRPGRRGEDNIRMEIRQIGCEGVDWIQLTQHRDQ